MIRHLLVALAFVLVLDTAEAVRVIEQIERPVELALDGVTWPTSSGDAIIFSDCPSCGISTHVVTDTTVYQVNGQALPLQEFLGVVAVLRERPAAMAVVFLDIASERVTRIEVRG